MSKSASAIRAPAAIVLAICLLGGCLDSVRVSQAVREANAAVIDQQQASAFLSADMFQPGDGASDAAINSAIAELSAAIEAVKDNPKAAAPLRLRLALIYLNANLVNTARNTKEQIVETDLAARDAALLSVWDTLETLEAYRRRSPGQLLCRNRGTPDNFCPDTMADRQRVLAALAELKEQGLDENREIASYLNQLAAMMAVTVALESIGTFEGRLAFLEDKVPEYLGFVSCATFRDYAAFLEDEVDFANGRIDMSLIGPVYRLYRVLAKTHPVIIEIAADPDVEPAARQRAAALARQLDPAAPFDGSGRCAA